MASDLASCSSSSSVRPSKRRLLTGAHSSHKHTAGRAGHQFVATWNTPRSSLPIWHGAGRDRTTQLPSALRSPRDRQPRRHRCHRTGGGRPGTTVRLMRLSGESAVSAGGVLGVAFGDPGERNRRWQLRCDPGSSQHQWSGIRGGAFCSHRHFDGVCLHVAALAGEHLLHRRSTPGRPGGGKDPPAWTAGRSRDRVWIAARGPW